MAEIQKPTTMLMDEFKEKFVELLNNSQLPAWVLIYLIEPYVQELKQVEQRVKIEEREEYEKTLKETEEKTEN